MIYYEVDIVFYILLLMLTFLLLFIFKTCSCLGEHMLENIRQKLKFGPLKKVEGLLEPTYSCKKANVPESFY